MKKPPFCPNKECEHYHKPRGHWYVKNGSINTKRSGRVQKYYCKSCRTTFCTETFSLNYRTQKKVSYKSILTHLVTSSGIRDISRDLGVSCSTITNRIARLSRQAMAVSYSLCEELHLTEDLVADGIESFVCSQYAPNNINILAGKESQFWILSDYAQMTRKGTMTESQKEKNRKLKAQVKLNRTTIYRSFQNVVRTACHLTEHSGKQQVTLYTDEHLQYRQVMEMYGKDGDMPIEHKRINSKVVRNLVNPLFSVNYLDREIRKDCADHTRETVQFARNAANLMDRLAIYRLYHNFIKPFRIDGDEKDRRRSHGEVAGISAKSIVRELKTLFTRRRFLGKCPWLNSADLRVWLRSVATPFKMQIDPLPAFARA